MFVRFLPKSNDFSAVIYNFDKVHDGDAILLETGNFGALESLRYQKPEDYINYFYWLSSLNHRIQNAQLHAVISSKGKSTTPEALKLTAKHWLQEMDYSAQPYLIFFHGDTNNNHVHIVSCRVRKNGTVISNSFDRYRSVESIARITGNSIEENIARDRREVLSYHFQSREAFELLMQRKRYRLTKDATGFNVYKYRRLVTKIDFSEVDAFIVRNLPRPIQQGRVKNIIFAALKDYDRTAKPVYRTLSGERKGSLIGYRSDLSDYLQAEFGLETIYQSDERGLVKDYYIIDPSHKQILEGSMLVPAEIFLGTSARSAGIQIPDYPDRAANSQKVQKLFSHFNLSISDDVDDASLYHKNKNRNI